MGSLHVQSALDRRAGNGASARVLARALSALPRRIRRAVLTPLATLTFALGLTTAGFAGTALAQGESPVGEVTLQIGQAVRVASDGSSQPVTRGMRLQAGDRVETAAGGHVHIRFVDGALVSVRPTSRLVVEEYRYDPSQVSASSVRFRLEQGTARAISGAAAEAARDRFRLNTPLVAIGVRGTDFVVRTRSDHTVATVNQGAIVMAPFGEGCLADALGPCGGSPRARLLSAEMGSLFAEFTDKLAQPELRALDTRSAAAFPLARAQAAPGPDSPNPNPAAPPASPAAQGARESARAGLPTDEAVALASVQEAVRKVTQSDLQALAPAPPALAWGRWAETPAGASDFSMPRPAAREGREVTVGNDSHLLYRVQPAGDALRFAANLGALSFDLQNAHARYTDAHGQSAAAAVRSGQLQIDFAQRRFQTALNLSSAATGEVPLSASGTVRVDGLLNSTAAATPADTRVAGAVAADARTAGYLFEKAAAGGVLSGITLWSR